MPAETPTAGGEVVVDVVMPARDEASTIAANIAAAKSCRYVREVIVVDDGSTDATADLAAAAGVKVVRRARLDRFEGPRHAGGRRGHRRRPHPVRGRRLHRPRPASTSTPSASRCSTGRAEMSLGAFDYGWLNWLVLRCPPLSGERIVPRWVWDAVPEDKLDGYTIEVRLNEVICEGRLRTSARTMVGVYHRTKRDKFGRLEGLRRTWLMYRDLLSMLKPIGDVRWRTYWFYLRGLTIEDRVEPPA